MTPDDPLMAKTIHEMDLEELWARTRLLATEQAMHRRILREIEKARSEVDRLILKKTPPVEAWMPEEAP